MATQRRSREEWRPIIRKLEASGLNAVQFARRYGLVANTLRWWRGEFRNEHSAEIEFVELELVDEEEEDDDFEEVPDLFVELGDSGIGIRVPFGFDAGELRRVVRALC